MASTTTLFLVALLLVSSVCGDLCATCNKPQDILRGKPAILDQFNDANGRLTLFYFTFRGYVYERCSNEDCSATEGAVTALPGSFDGNKPFGAALMGNSIVAVTAQPTGQSWTVTVAINGNVVSSFPVYGQLTDMEVIGSTSSPAFIGLTGKNQGKNFAIVYTVGTTGITGPAVAETSATSNQPNTISGIVGNGGQAIFVTTTDGNLVSVVACANPTCTSVRSTPVEKFAAVSTQQGVSITLRNNYPVIFVAVPNLPLQVAYCTDVFCSARTISTTAHPSNPQTSSLAPDGTVVVASNRGSSVIVVKCQDAVCTEESVPLQVNGLSNPLVSLIPSPTGVVLLLKTLQRALLVNLCGPFPQSLSPVEVTTTVKAELTIQGVGFCPQDSIARLEDYPFPARYVSPNEVRVALGPNVLPGSYQVGLQNQNGQRFGVVLSSDLSVKNGCPLNCSGHVGHGYCNGFAGKCACNPGWTGSDCGQPVNGSPCPNCGPNGVCDARTRQCRCFNGYSGPTCSNTGKTCPNACNGHGKCNFATGECKCSFFWCGAGCTKIWPLCS